MKILVTGAAGFVASHLCERLLGLGHQVVGIDSIDPYYSTAFKRHTVAVLEERGIDMRELDLAEGPLEALLEEVEVVFHLAGQPGIAAHVPFANYVRNNVLATHRLLDACLSASHLRAFIFISTSSVYGKFATGDETTAPTPTSNYGVTKLAAEQLVLAHHRELHFPACALRLFSVYGERERPDKLYPRLIKAAAGLERLPLYQGSLDHQRSFTYVGDIVDACTTTLDKWEVAKGEIFNIGNDRTATTREGIRLVEKITGRTIPFDTLPPRSGDQQRTHANIAKAREILGYRPKTSLEKGLTRMVAWHQDQILGKVEY